MSQSCFFRAGKEEWQKFAVRTVAKDQKEQDLVWHEAILFSMWLTKDVWHD